MDLDNTVFLSHTPDHFLWNHASVMLFLGTSAASIILVSGKKMSESQTKAGNQGKFKKKNKKFANLKFLNFFKFLKKFNFVNIKNDPRDMLNNFCFHVSKVPDYR